MNMREFKEQLELYLFTNKLTPFAFSKASGIGQSSLSRLLNDEVKNTLKQKTRQKISEYFNIPFEEIDMDPSIINTQSLSPYSKIVGMPNSCSRVIAFMTYDEYLSGNKDNIKTLPVTNDISERCFALKVQNSDLDPYICSGDIIIVNPDINLTKSQYIGKNLVFMFQGQILLRKALVVENEIFLKGKKIVHYDQDKYELLGWVTEIRIKNRSFI